MKRFPETIEDIHKLIKENGSHHKRAVLNRNFDVHLWVLPKDEAVDFADGSRVYIACESYSYKEIDPEYALRISDPVATLTGPSMNGQFRVDPIAENEKIAAVARRFSGIQATEPEAIADVLCDWSLEENGQQSKRSIFLAFRNAPRKP